MPYENITQFYYYLHVCLDTLTAPFNNMQTLKFKAQPTNACFATVNQMFGGSSQLPTTAERCLYCIMRLFAVVSQVIE